MNNEFTNKSTNEFNIVENHHERNIKEDSLIMLEYLRRHRYKYIARNRDNTLMAYKDTILKDSKAGEWLFIIQGNSYPHEEYRCTYLEEELFPEITWEDEKEYII